MAVAPANIRKEMTARAVTTSPSGGGNPRVGRGMARPLGRGRRAEIRENSELPLAYPATIGKASGVGITVKVTASDLVAFLLLAQTFFHGPVLG
jgi:hypothetical protein